MLECIKNDDSYMLFLQMCVVEVFTIGIDLEFYVYHLLLSNSVASFFHL